MPEDYLSEWDRIRRDRVYSVVNGVGAAQSGTRGAEGAAGALSLQAA